MARRRRMRQKNTWLRKNQSASGQEVEVKIDYFLTIEGIRGAGLSWEQVFYLVFTFRKANYVLNWVLMQF